VMRCFEWRIALFTIGHGPLLDSTLTCKRCLV
jgi:hypothetical protein